MSRGGCAGTSPTTGPSTTKSRAAYCGCASNTATGSTPQCDPRCVENQQPAGYVAASEWAEFMAETDDQQQCPGCGLWTIWVERTTQAQHEPTEERT